MDSKLLSSDSCLATSVRHGSALAKQFASFTGVGAAATLLQYLVLVLLVHAVAMNPSLASATGYVAGAVLNYALNYRYTFRSTADHRTAVARFVIVASIGLTLNTIIMATLIDGFGLHYLVSQVLATGIVLVWNFAANRRWTFGR